MKRASGEGVAVAWARTLALPAVATTLPDVSQWPVLAGTVRGFVTVDAVVGGTVLDNPLRAPIVQFSAWAAVLDSDRPQWNAANELIETLWNAQYDLAAFPALVQQDAEHLSARVLAVRGLGEPARKNDPDESRAHFTCDLQMWWTEVSA